MADQTAVPVSMFIRKAHSTFDGFHVCCCSDIVLTERSDRMNPTSIGKFIAECRKDKHLTQCQLAEMLNTTNKSVSKWENGSCLPDVSLYEPLCSVLGITLNELFSGQKLQEETIQRAADVNLMRMLKYKLYQFSDKSISFEEFDHALNKIAEVSTILMQFSSKNEAVDYLLKGTHLPLEECSAAYDYYIHLFKTSENISQ